MITRNMYAEVPVASMPARLQTAFDRLTTDCSIDGEPFQRLLCRLVIFAYFKITVSCFEQDIFSSAIAATAEGWQRPTQSVLVMWCSACLGSMPSRQPLGNTTCNEMRHQTGVRLQATSSSAATKAHPAMTGRMGERRYTVHALQFYGLSAWIRVVFRAISTHLK